MTNGPSAPALAGARRSFRGLPHIGPWVGDEPVTVRHLDQWQGGRVHDVLLADDAVAVEKVGGHRVYLVGCEGAGLIVGCARRM